MFPVIIHQKINYTIEGLRTRNPLAANFVLALNGEEFLENSTMQLSGLDKMRFVRDHLENLFSAVQDKPIQCVPMMEKGECIGMMVISRNSKHLKKENATSVPSPALFKKDQALYLPLLRSIYPNVDIHNFEDHLRPEIRANFEFFEQASSQIERDIRAQFVYPLLEVDETLKEKMYPVLSLLSHKELQQDTPKLNHSPSQPRL